MGVPAALHRRQPRPAGRWSRGSRSRWRQSARGVIERVVELVVGARGGVDHDGVPVARGALATLDRRVGTEWVRPGIVSGGAERDGDQGMRRGHHRDGHAVLRPMDEIEVGGGGALHALRRASALWGSTGKPAMGVFQTLSAGNTRALGAPGTGVPADRDLGTPPTVRPSHSSAVVTNATAGLLIRRLGVPLFHVDGIAHGAVAPPMVRDDHVEVIVRYHRARRDDRAVSRPAPPN